VKQTMACGRQRAAQLVLAFLFGIAGTAFGQSLDLAKPDPLVEARLKGLAEELRCLVCQNQTIADSSAPLALDLRNQIRTQIAQGRSDDEIRAYMVQRYGDFVLYKPPFKATTAILWLAPFLLLLVGSGVFWTVVARRRSNAPAREPDPRRRAEIEALLDELGETKARRATGSPSGTR
jgi:cytochrome c-type biogenesis protein CcmH